MKDNVIELSEEFGVVVTVCTNDETVCFGLNLDDCDEDSGAIISRAAWETMERELDGRVSVDSWFPNWNGGRYDRGNRAGLVHASFRHRTIDTCADEDGEEYFSYGDWEWIDAREVPAELSARVTQAMDAACDAVREKSAEREELHRLAVAAHAAESEE